MDRRTQLINKVRRELLFAAVSLPIIVRKLMRVTGMSTAYRIPAISLYFLSETFLSLSSIGFTSQPPEQIGLHRGKFLVSQHTLRVKLCQLFKVVIGCAILLCGLCIQVVLVCTAVCGKKLPGRYVDNVDYPEYAKAAAGEKLQ